MRSKPPKKKSKKRVLHGHEQFAGGPNTAQAAPCAPTASVPAPALKDSSHALMPSGQKLLDILESIQLALGKDLLALQGEAARLTQFADFLHRLVTADRDPPENLGYVV
jgi:hypothetical protein